MDSVKEYGLPGYRFKDPAVRHIKEEDISALIDLFKSNYGDDYPLVAFYNPDYIKANIYSDHIVWLVLEEEGKLAASGALLLNAGDYNDQAGEIGRLVVHKEMQGRNLGRRMINALFEAADDTVEFAYGEARTFHPVSQLLMKEAGFFCFGFVPLYYDLGSHVESIALYSTLYGNAKTLRKESSPRVTEEVFPLANMVLSRAGLEPAITANAELAAHDFESFFIRHLERKDLPRLLRLRHTSSEPLCFGNIGIEQGISTLRRKKAVYETLISHDEVIGAIGYYYDQTNRILKINEMLADTPGAMTRLCHYIAEELPGRLNARVVSIKVSAYLPSLQKTLLSLHFRPTAYAIAAAFFGYERFDCIYMHRFFYDHRENPAYQIELIPGAKETADLVMNLP